MAPTVVVTHPGCPGTSDGSIDLSVSGGNSGIYLFMGYLH
ncbi:MAG: hypothetical protein IPJ26_16335 [Bacteroidetes bacterium]|nr:hypothetical protein [Bacteroidota bacterium]